jgi:hypothetical protein
MKHIFIAKKKLFIVSLISLLFLTIESLLFNLSESISAPWQLYFQDHETPIM